MRICLAQINPTVGDLDGNFAKIRSALAEARSRGVRIVSFPELVLTGYPPEDLLFKKAFILKNASLLKRLAPHTRGLLAFIGYVNSDDRGRLYNAMGVFWNGTHAASYRKTMLPNYGVFDEKRYFEAGEGGLILAAGPYRLGLSICEDIWIKDSFAYQPPYTGSLSMLVNISASPYHYGKQAGRRGLISALAQHTEAHVLYTNLVGGQDELVFDGGSLLVSPEGKILAEGGHCSEDCVYADIFPKTTDPGVLSDNLPVVRLKDWEKIPPRRLPRLSARTAREPSLEAEIYEALILGTRDYALKNGFKKALVGLSGGIDSALVAAVAVDSLGKQNVWGVTMPSEFSSPATYRDAKLVASKLGIRLLDLSIVSLYREFLSVLKKPFFNAKPDVTEENLQSRIRGILLMALSNKFGHLVLTTGNKSEMATGFCTLYGDMAGGFAVLKDVPKTLVFRLSRYLNNRSKSPVIPDTILRRAPTAELRHKQKDSDTLPPYPQLDRILKAYIEEDADTDQIIRSGLPAVVVKNAIRLVDRSEYKRRQSPPGAKITAKAFGRDRRMPITNRFPG